MEIFCRQQKPFVPSTCSQRGANDKHPPRRGPGAGGCFYRGRKSTTFKTPFFKLPFCSLKGKSLPRSPSEWNQDSLKLSTSRPPPQLTTTKVDELPVSNLAPSQHLALWCSRGDQPRMNSAGENVQGGWEPGSQGQNTPSLPRRRAPQLSQPQNPSSALSPPLLSWQGVFCCYPAPPFLIPAQCLLQAFRRLL